MKGSPVRPFRFQHLREYGADREVPAFLVIVDKVGLDPWVGKIPWRRESLPAPVFWPGEFRGLSALGHKESDTTEQPSVHFISKL